MSKTARKISLQKGEAAEGDRIHLLRLDETGIGTMETGDRCLITEPTTDEERLGEVVSVERKRLKELSEEDASRVLSPPGNNLPDLLHKLEQYRFRPQWDQGNTRFRILEIELSEEGKDRE